MTDIQALPDEVLEFILSLVSPYGELKACALTCHRWNECSKNVIRKKQADFIRSIQEMRMDWSACTNATTAVTNDNPQSHCHGNLDPPVEKIKALTVGKRYSHSAVYDDATDSMFIFGGCTSTATTFNDLWRLDLTTRRWHRPIATGTYPSPKACSVLVKYKKKLILFGGWTHPSMYPLHRWRLFNELHSYDIENSTWTQLLTPAPANRENLEDDTLRPPTMAGHSATIHRGKLIVFGGLQKQRNSIGQFSSSSDVWSFDLERMSWMQEDIPEPRPTPRYGQSQLYLDETHLLILGGCGGPSNIFNDVWLLSMGQANQSSQNLPGGTVHWKWSRCRVDNSLHGANHMWCHPAVKVGDFAVILGKNRLPKKQNTKKNQVPQNNLKQAARHRAQPSSSASQHDEARWNVIPHLRRGVNRGYGAIRRVHPTSVQRISQQEGFKENSDNDNSRAQPDIGENNNDRTPTEPMAISDGEDNELSVIPMEDFESSQKSPQEANSSTVPNEIFRSHITLNITSDTDASDVKSDSGRSENLSYKQPSSAKMDASGELHQDLGAINSDKVKTTESKESQSAPQQTSSPTATSNSVPKIPKPNPVLRATTSDECQAHKSETSTNLEASINLTRTKTKEQGISEIALSEHVEREHRNSFRNCNEKQASQKSLSDINGETPSIQPSSSVPKSRNPKVSAISFNKSAAGQLGAGNEYFE